MIMHYFDAESAMHEKYGKNILLVKDEEKVRYFTNKYGKPVDSIFACSNETNGSWYSVFLTEKKTSSVFQFLCKIGVYKPLN